MSILISDVRDLIPVDAGIIPDVLIQEYIDIVTTEADLQLKNIFADPLTAVTEADCQNYDTKNTSGTCFVPISAWQESGLTIKRTDKKNSHQVALTETPLVLGEDYILWHGWQGKKIPGLNLPVTNIQLLCDPLCKGEILRVAGTYGWQAGYPSEVKQVLANIIVGLAGYAQNTANQGGVTGAITEKSMTTLVEFSATMAKDLQDRAKYMLNDPAFLAILNKYNVVLDEGLTVI